MLGVIQIHVSSIGGCTGRGVDNTLETNFCVVVIHDKVEPGWSVNMLSFENALGTKSTN